jgi:hypothetical protein
VVLNSISFCLIGKGARMNRFVFAPALVFALSFTVSQAADVIVPNGKTAVVTQREFVRIVASGIAASTIEVEITGNAKLNTERRIIKQANGRRLIGKEIREYEIKPTGKGYAKVKVTVTPPNGDARVTEYEIQIK